MLTGYHESAIQSTPCSLFVNKISQKQKNTSPKIWPCENPLVLHACCLGHTKGMVPSSIDGMEIPGFSKLLQGAGQFFHIAQRVPDSCKKEHWIFNPAKMGIPKLLFVAKGVERVSQKYKTVHRQKAVGTISDATRPPIDFPTATQGSASAPPIFPAIGEEAL